MCRRPRDGLIPTPTCSRRRRIETFYSPPKRTRQGEQVAFNEASTKGSGGRAVTEAGDPSRGHGRRCCRTSFVKNRRRQASPGEVSWSTWWWRTSRPMKWSECGHVKRGAQRGTRTKRSTMCGRTTTRMKGRISGKALIRPKCRQQGHPISRSRTTGTTRPGRRSKPARRAMLRCGGDESSAQMVVVTTRPGSSTTSSTTETYGNPGTKMGMTSECMLGGSSIARR